MSQRKREQSFVGVHHFLALKADLYLLKHGLTLPRNDLDALVRLALAPERMHGSLPFCDIRYTEGVNAFKKGFKERPDDLLEVLSFIRELFASARDTAKGSVQQFLLVNEVVVKRSNRLMPLGKDDSDADGDSTPRRLVPVADLTDGELAALVLGHKTKKAEHTAKKARQALQKELERLVLESFAQRNLNPPRWQPPKGIK